MATDKPRIGLLGITQELYDDVVKGITEYQNHFGAELVSWFSSSVEIVFPGPAKNRKAVESTVSRFNEQGLDGIMVVMLTYAPSLFTIEAFRSNRLPLLLANLQPERTVASSWDMASLTYNQGIHGIQDLANCLYKLGMRPPIVSGDWKAPAFGARLLDWALAARTAARLRKARIAAFGQMPGMGDITSDPNDMMRCFGPQIDQLHVGTLSELMSQVKPAAVEAAMAKDRENFVIAADLPAESHRYASTIYLALREFLLSQHYDGFCVHFDSLGRDGRFRQLHMLAASNLMAEGFGYAAEGDVLCASLMVAGQSLEKHAHFTEMYAMDFDRNAFLMSHMGEGNWKIARRDVKPKLIRRELRIGGLEDPPTVLFSAQPGPATLVSLSNVGGGLFRMVALEGSILDDAGLPGLEMPYFFLRPRIRAVSETATRWLESAGTHHQTLHLGSIAGRWEMLSRILGIEFVRIDTDDGR
jgi:L-arabinose isomerase